MSPMTTRGGPPPGLVVAVDLGGTGIKAALVARDGAVVRSVRRETRREAGPLAVLDRVTATAAELAETCVASTGRAPLAAGVAVPGLVDTERGVARYSANLGWRDLPLRALLTERLGLPVALGHDVRAGALAEGRLGAGSGHDDFLFVALGTGVAAAHVRQGRVLDGSRGGAGELGHLVLRAGGPRCGCGRRGCLETLASASAVARRYAEASGCAETGAAGRQGRAPARKPGRAQERGQEQGHEQGHEQENAVTAERVRELAGAGDPVARRVWRTAVHALADGLAAYTVLCEPGLVVLGGGLARAGADLTDPLREALARRLSFHRPPPLALAALGDRAGCQGAALLALDLAVAV
ncbi:ROK family protein [Streptomyces sp. NPDC088812]|uniref:ROK family protein n=1 Tax=Streptomyces sp. NPDC088812 TaxID=3365905 RepID=UPI00382D56CC